MRKSLFLMFFIGMFVLGTGGVKAQFYVIDGSSNAAAAAELTNITYGGRLIKCAVKATISTTGEVLSDRAQIAAFLNANGCATKTSACVTKEDITACQNK